LVLIQVLLRVVVDLLLGVRVVAELDANASFATGHPGLVGHARDDVGLQAAAGLADVDGLVAPLHGARAERDDERLLDVVLETGKCGVARVARAYVADRQILGLVNELGPLL
jgi:hypothetical protein